jgi:hypothetical protein
VPDYSELPVGTVDDFESWLCSRAPVGDLIRLSLTFRGEECETPFGHLTQAAGYIDALNEDAVSDEDIQRWKFTDVEGYGSTLPGERLRFEESVRVYLAGLETLYKCELIILGCW